MKIATISIASMTGPLPRMISVVEVTSYLAQCALHMKLIANDGSGGGDEDTDYDDDDEEKDHEDDADE